MMTMTSDKRREVAERLRELASSDDTRYAEPFCEQLTDIVDFPFDGTNKLPNVADNLADLIDPTCENVSDTHPSDGFTCSKCGWSGRVEEDDTDLDVYQKPMFDDFAEYSPRHCPRCGTRVVGE